MRRAILGALTVCAPMRSETSASISSRATALTDSRITSPCSSRSTCRTTSSIVILSRPAIAGLLSSNPEEVRRS